VQTTSADVDYATIQTTTVYNNRTGRYVSMISVVFYDSSIYTQTGGGPGLKIDRNKHVGCAYTVTYWGQIR